MKFKTFVIFVLLLFVGCAKNDLSNQKNVRVSAPEVDAAEPAIAAASNGVFVAWVEHGADKTANVFVQRFAADGTPNGEKTRVNGDDGIATAWRGDQPTIVVDRNNAIYVGWTARVGSADQHSADIMLSVSRDDGKSFLPPVRVNDDQTPGAHGMHSLAVDERGTVYLAWLDERYLKETAANENNNLPNGFYYQKAHDEKPHNEKPRAAKPVAQHGEANREIYFAASADGGKSFSPNKKLAGDVCPCCKTTLLAAPDKKVYVAWRQVLADDFRHVAVASSTDGGANFATPTIVSDDQWQIKGCPVSGAALASGANNTVQVAWFTAGASGTTGIYQTHSIDSGQNFAARQLVSPGAAFGTPVLVSDNATNIFPLASAADGNSPD